MLRPTVIEVKPLEDYSLILRFDNGEERKFNVKPYIQGSWYGMLEDKSYFRSVKPNGFSVEWVDGQDLCPDELYYESSLVEAK